MTEEEYKKEIDELEKLGTTASFLSIKNQGREIPSWREEEASLIFGRIAITSISILKITPKSSFYSSYNGIDFWDLSSIAALTRNIIEAVNIFFYVGIDEITEEESEFRHLIWLLHAKIEVREVIDKINPGSPNLDALDEEIRNIRGQLKNNKIYAKLAVKKTRKNIGREKKYLFRKKRINQAGRSE